MFNIYQLDFRWVLMPTSTLDDLFIPSKSIEAGLVLMTEQLPASQPWNKVGTMAPTKKSTTERSYDGFNKVMVNRYLVTTTYK